MTMSLGNGTVLCDIDSRGVVTVSHWCELPEDPK